MLVVEGPDGSGKTTLIKAIQQEYVIPVAQRVVSVDGKRLTSLSAWVEAELALGDRPLIYDRHRLISNPIYSPILGRASEDAFLNAAWVMNMTEAFYALNPVIIYCLPPVEAIRVNCETDPSNQWLASDVNRLYEAYVAKAASDAALRPQHTIIWDYTSDGQEDQPLLGLTNSLNYAFHIFGE